MKISAKIAILMCLALFAWTACQNPASDGDEKETAEHLISGQFSSSYSAGTGIFYADYADETARAAVQHELKGKLEDGDIVFSLSGFIDGSGAFSLSAGSSALIYQITGKEQNKVLSDAKVKIQIKNGEQWVEHEAAATQAEKVSITKPDSPGQINSAIPSSWQGGWQGKATGDTEYNTLVVTPFSIIVYPPAGAAKIISLLETEAAGTDTVTFVILENDADGIAYYKCSLVLSGSTLRFTTWLNSKTLVMVPNALQLAKAYNTAADSGANVKIIEMNHTDRTSLRAIISTASAAKAGVAASADGGDIPAAVYWVTAEQLAAFNAAISVAEAVYDNTGTDQTAADNATAALQNAVTAFNGQKKAGLMTKAMYVTGEYGQDFPPKLAYWKDGVRHDLAMPVTDDRMGMITGIALAGNDVYVSGYFSFTSGQAYYWKNGSIHELPVQAGATSSFANTIAVSGSGDVYIGGNYQLSESESKGCYWKNGVRTDVSSAEYIADILIIGDDVYMLGQDNGNSICYWKNGVKTIVDTSDNFCYTIAVSNSDVYVTGAYVGGYDGIGAIMKPCYWKNGTKTILSSTGEGMATSIAILGTDVYIAGDADGRIGCYWLNGIKYTLPGVSNGFVSGMTVDGNDVYMVGDNSEFVPCYWKNGVKTDLPAEIRRPSAILVK